MSVTIPWDDDASAGGWIAGRLGEFGTVGGNIPLGYEVYVRIPNHPDGEETGSTLIQEHVEPDQLTRLLAVLGPATGDQVCHFAIWNGFGWMSDHGTDPAALSSLQFVVAMSPEATPEERAEAEREAIRAKLTYVVERPDAPMLLLPHREYHLWCGALPLARAFARQEQSPTLWWPQDRSWFVASDIDAEFTDIGGARAVLEPLLRDPAWGATEVSAGDPIVAVWESHPH